MFKNCLMFKCLKLQINNNKKTWKIFHFTGENSGIPAARKKSDLNKKRFKFILQFIFEI